MPGSAGDPLVNGVVVQRAIGQQLVVVITANQNDPAGHQAVVHLIGDAAGVGHNPQAGAEAIAAGISVVVGDGEGEQIGRIADVVANPPPAPENFCIAGMVAMAVGNLDAGDVAAPD